MKTQTEQQQCRRCFERDLQDPDLSESKLIDLLAGVEFIAEQAVYGSVTIDCMDDGSGYFVDCQSGPFGEGKDLIEAIKNMHNKAS
jgi:hypothetical protein